MPELAQELPRTSERRLRKVVEEAIEDGVVVPFWAGNRTMYTTEACRPTLGWVYEQAMEHAYDPDHQGSPGRRRSDEDRRVEVIGRKDRERITTAINHIGRYLAGDRGASRDEIRDALERTDRALLIWDPEAGAGGQGDWAAALELLDRAVPGGARPGLISGLRKLLDLAATHGWLARTARHAEGYEPVPPEWAQVYEEWRAVEDVKSPGAVLDLLEGVTASGFASPEEADWAEVISHLEATFRGRDTPSNRRSQIRHTYRELRRAGSIDGPGWDGRMRQVAEGVTLLRGNEIRAAGEVYGSDAIGDENPWSWQWPRQHELQALIDGPFGLRTVLLAMTRPMVEVETQGLPSRATFPRVAHRGTSVHTETAWSIATCRRALGDIAYLLGWLEQEYAIDWATADLRELLDRDRIEAHVRWSLSPNGTTTGSLHDRAITIGRIASPILETIALRRAWRLDDAGEDAAADYALADQAAEIAAYLSGANGYMDGREKKRSITAITKDEGEDKDIISKMIKESQKFEAAWAPPGGGCGYDQMLRIHDALIGEITNLYGDLRTQLDDLPGTQRDGEWAKHVEETLWWTDMITVPLRASNLRRATREMRETDRAGRIVAHYPGRIGKRKNASFSPVYADDPDSTHALLYRLYVAPGGALEIILGRPPRAGDPFWPSYRTGRRYRNASAFTDMMRRIVKRHQAALVGVTYDELLASGTLRAKFFRHALAKALAMDGKAALASILLHHANGEMVQKVYGPVGETDIVAADAVASLREQE